MKKLLIVDDSPEVLDGMKRRFGSYCDILATSDPREAMRIFEEAKPDLVLLDFDLKDVLNGEDLLKRMKEMSPQVPVAMMTGTRGIRSRLLQEGACAFFDKSLDDLQRLEAFLRERSILES